jgi:para-aminobenzoate synthetase/4-amino-4-deoxychorismate lyase
MPPVKTFRVGFARDPVREDDVFLYHKTTHREVYERARRSRPDCDDVILWNTRGEATETTLANLVVDINGESVTPPVACGLLAGTMRSRLLADGIVKERVLRREEVLGAQSVRLINSVRGWIPAELVRTT